MNKTTSETRAGYKAVPFRPDDHAKIDALRTKLAYQRGSQLSLSQTVMECVKLMNEKVDREAK